MAYVKNLVLRVLEEPTLLLGVVSSAFVLFGIGGDDATRTKDLIEAVLILLGSVVVRQSVTGPKLRE